jgi:TetR/AcrR family transcriptional regulator
MSSAGENTENLILNAARRVFIAKGYECARMQEIADDAGINKALLHYYFRSKEKLFEAVFSEVAAGLFPAMKQVLESDLGIREKLTFFIKVYLKTLRENPFIPSFVLNTLNTSPERFIMLVRKSGFNPAFIQNQLDAEAKQGLIRNVRAEHLLVNIVSMCIFPFVARPILQNMFDMSDSEYVAYLSSREAEITDSILKSISL